MSTMKIDKQKIRELTFDIEQAIQKHLNKTNMNAAEIQMALTQVIYRIGVTVNLLEQERALREKALLRASGKGGIAAVSDSTGYFISCEG